MDIDLSDFMSMAMMFDSTGMSEDDFANEMQSNLDTDGMSEALNEMSGVSNASMEFVDGSKIVWRFDFEDVEALNASFQELNDAVMSGELINMDGVEIPEDAAANSNPASYTKKGKTITHRSELDMGEVDSMMGGEDEGMMDMVMSMIDFTVEFTFDRKIKDVQISGLDILTQEDKVIRTRVDLKSAMETGAYEISVRVK